MKPNTIRHRLEAQGFLGLSDGEVSDLNYWLRLAPAICLIWTAIGVLFASSMILFCLVPLALLGAILTGHPFDVIYNHGIRYVTGGCRLPVYGLPRRFACLMAAVMISFTGIVFEFGYLTVGYVLGSTMLFMATVNVVTGFCVPSFIFGLVFGKQVCPLQVLDRRSEKD